MDCFCIFVGLFVFLSFSFIASLRSHGQLVLVLNMLFSTFSNHFLAVSFKMLAFHHDIFVFIAYQLIGSLSSILGSKNNIH